MPFLEQPPSAYIKNFFYATQPIEEPEDAKHFHAILEMFDAERMLMFATDYPHWDGDTPDFTARAFPKALRPAIMGGNALALYRLTEALDG